MHDHGAGCPCTAPKSVQEKPDIRQARAIVAATAAASGFTADDIFGDRRFSTVAHYRHFAMYLIRNRTSLSLPEIGRLFDRHHTSVIYAVRKVADNMVAGDRGTLATLARIVERIPQEA